MQKVRDCVTDLAVTHLYPLQKPIRLYVMSCHLGNIDPLIKLIHLSPIMDLSYYE